MVKIALFGATGLIGSAIMEKLKEFYSITAISGRTLYEEPLKISELISGYNIVINLSGNTISGRWTSRKKKLIEESRIITTINLVKSIALLDIKPDLYINASGISIYNDRIVSDENSQEFSDNFLAEVVKKWERAALKSSELNINTAIIRLGVVLSRNGGAYQKLRQLVNLFVGGPVGHGTQGMSVIHIDDLIRAIHFIIINRMTGIINLCIPKPTTNHEFIKNLAHLLNRPALFRMPVFVLKLILLDGHTLLSEGQRAIPGRLLDKGFIFNYPDIYRCISNLEE